MSFQKAADLIKNSSYMIAFTGAGISTPSGIPDFRSPSTGLWNLIDPSEIPTLTKFKIDPESFYINFKSLVTNILKAEPNPAHYALVQFEKLGLLNSIITQNIDMLHQKSGSKTVIELHGTLKTATCIKCYKKVKLINKLKTFLKDNKIPICEKCGSYLKPDIILFEEQLPYEAWQHAKEDIANCDLLLVIGSSLETFPAAHLPYEAITSGANMIMINKSETYINTDINVFIKNDASIILPQILALI